MSAAPTQPNPPARQHAGAHAQAAANRTAAARPGGPSAAGGGGKAFANLLADQIAADNSQPIAPPPSTEPVSSTERAPEPASAKPTSDAPQDARPETPTAPAGAAAMPASDRSAAADADAADASSAAASTAAARLAATKDAAVAGDAPEAHGLTPDAGSSRLGAHAEAAGGEHALADPAWRAAEVARETAPAVPIAPSADGALPSLLAPGEVAAPASAQPASDAPATGAPAQAHLPQQPGSEAFTQALSQQLRTWLRGSVGHARLSLNPAELGPIDVRIAVTGGRADVQLAAQVASTREALAQALPLLTQQLDGAGLTLTGGDVRDGRDPGARRESGAQPRANEAGGAEPGSAQGSAGDAAAAHALAALTRTQASGRGLLDLYA